MNKGNLRILAIVLAGLVLALFALRAGNDDSDAGGELLFPHLKGEINDVTNVTITRHGEDEPTVVSRVEQGWIIASRDGYAADVGKLRELLLALADARLVERKTSNPELYERLGIRDPAAEDSDGVLLELQGTSSDYRLIVGNTAQGGYRYVRIAGDPQGWLIDKNPAIPDSPGGWLEKSIVDIKAAGVRSVVIHHQDGEEIRIGKESADATDFEVMNIPEGRELSYAAIANSIGGALNALTLDDVRKAEGSTADVVTTTFETFDGVRVVVATVEEEDEYWISVQAAAVEQEPDAAPADAGQGDATGTAASVTDKESDPVESAASINARVAGWQYRIPEYKANQLTRRFDDILKAESD